MVIDAYMDSTRKRWKQSELIKYASANFEIKDVLVRTRQLRDKSPSLYKVLCKWKRLLSVFRISSRAGNANNVCPMLFGAAYTKQFIFYGFILVMTYDAFFQSSSKSMPDDFFSNSHILMAGSGTAWICFHGTATRKYRHKIKSGDFAYEC